MWSTPADQVHYVDREPRFDPQMTTHTIYFVRHGETDWNAARRIQGHTDIPLNATGRAQAARNGRVLRGLIADPASVTYVASPLSRASDTMRIARGEMGLDPEGFEREERLKELNFGALEGEPWIGDQLAKNPALYPARSKDPFGWRPEGGESYADLTRRLEAWLATLAGSTVVVSHGGVMRALRGHLLGLDKHGIPNLSTPQDQVLIVTRGQERWA